MGFPDKGKNEVGMCAPGEQSDFGEGNSNSADQNPMIGVRNIDYHHGARRYGSHPRDTINTDSTTFSVASTPWHDHKPIAFAVKKAKDGQQAAEVIQRT